MHTLMCYLNFLQNNNSFDAATFVDMANRN